METVDNYAGVAARYERYREEDPQIVAFFKRLIAEDKIRKVLDCSCGAGRELLMLNELGCEVTGSDISPAMLELAAQNLAEAGADIPLHEADYRDLPDDFSNSFDAVICWSGSIFHVADDEEALRTFESMREVLAPGGMVVMDQGLTDKRWRDQHRFMLNRSTADTSQVYVVDYFGDRDCRYHILDLTHENGSHEMEVWSTDVHVLLREDQERLFKEAGFTSVKIYGSYDLDPYDKETSLRLIAIARK